MLLTPRERAAYYDGIRTRAVTPVAAAARTEGNQDSIAARVFSRSLMVRLGIPMPDVPAGSAGYPRLISGTTFSQQSASGEQLPVAGTFGGAELAPVRATAGYEWRIEDEYRLVGIEEALRRDLRDGMSNHMDNQVLNGNGTAPNVAGVLNAVAATPTTDPANADDFAEYVARFAGEVDGLNAYSQDELQVVLSTHAYDLGVALYRGTDSTRSAYDQLVASVGSVTVSNRLPAADNNDISNSVVFKSAFPERSAVAPVWASMMLVVDPFTNASKGERRLTAITLWNFAVLDAAAFAVKKIRSA